jgi:hypothetical protein
MMKHEVKSLTGSPENSAHGKTGATDKNGLPHSASPDCNTAQGSSGFKTAKAGCCRAETWRGFTAPLGMIPQQCANN